MRSRNLDSFAPAFNRAVSAYKAGNLAEAEQLCQQIVSARSDHFDALHVLAIVQAALGKGTLALANCDRALALRPDHADALSNRGNALLALNRCEEALASYDRALAVRPDFAEALSNRGHALERAGRLDEALASYDRALALQPRHVMAHCNAAALRLLRGDFARGWPHYEWRWMKQSVVLANRMFTQPLWRGEAIAGKTILLHSEQGLGDTIQFCRYVPLVAARGARVILEVQKPLRALMNGLGAAQVIAKGDPLPEFDLHCPLLSLPLAFGTTMETIPSANAYLAAPAQPSTAWQARLGATPRPRIGLAWSGRAGDERDRERSIGLRAFLPLLETGTAIVSLQNEVRTEDAIVLKERGGILNAGEEMGDFSDTAALMSQLDLVISVDTSVAHLAGAPGRPVWILVTHVPDWRWLLERDDSPWYPTARLFRQDATGTWDGALKRVHAAARAFVAGERR